MLLVHASFWEGQLVVWGETPPKTPQRITRKAQRQSRPDEVRISPLDAGTSPLIAALAEVVPGFTLKKGRADTWVAWLPTTLGAAPLASSPLIAEPPPQSAGASQLAPWKVSALRLTTAQAIELLCAAAGKTVLAPGIVVGTSLAFGAEALRFAARWWHGSNFCPASI